MRAGKNMMRDTRDRWRTGKPYALRHGLMAALAVAAIVLLCCEPRISAENGVPTITIHAVRYEFDPAEITLKKGKQVQLLFVADDVAHGISIPGLNIEADLPRHKTEVVTVTPSAAGDFDGECSKYCGAGHSEMTFTVHVTQ
jgi:cytochrome c oxidase subunit 2